MKATAYLCMIHAMGKDRVPRFRGFRTFSSPPWTLSAAGSIFHTIYYQVEADSYDEAHDRLLDICRNFPAFAWIWPWVDPSEEAHRKRYDMQRALEANGG